jgi:molybdopterin converting factor small subunit
MPVTIQIPAPMRQHAGGQSSANTPAGTVRSALAELGRQHPALVERLFDGEQPKRFLNLFVNDEDIRYLDGLDTALKDGDDLSIIPAVAGG